MDREREREEINRLFAALGKKVETAHEKAARERREADDEEAFEMRAAFGEGVEVVNIITGKRRRT